MINSNWKIHVAESIIDKSLIEMRPNSAVDPEASAWDAYVWVDEADALYEEFKSKGVNIARDICDQPYGCRDFDIEDCNGYRLCFGHTT